MSSFVAGNAGFITIGMSVLLSIFFSSIDSDKGLMIMHERTGFLMPLSSGIPVGKPLLVLILTRTTTTRFVPSLSPTPDSGQNPFTDAPLRLLWTPPLLLKMSYGQPSRMKMQQRETSLPTPWTLWDCNREYHIQYYESPWCWYCILKQSLPAPQVFLCRLPCTSTMYQPRNYYHWFACYQINWVN